MFPRGRPSVKRCGLSTILADCVGTATGHIPDEPLLFLYPSWFGSMFRQQRSSIHTRLSRRKVPNHASEELVETIRFQPRKQSFGASARKRWMATSSTSKLSKTDVPVETDTEKMLDLPAWEDTATPADTMQDEEEARLVTEHGNFDAFASPESDKSASSPLIQRRRVIKNRNKPRKDRDVIQKIRRESRKKHKASRTRLSLRDSQKVQFRMFYLSKVRRSRRVALVLSLRKMLETVERRAKAGELSKSALRRREVLVPDETLALVAGTTDLPRENIWYVPLRHGCRVHVLPADESVGMKRKVVLYGSESAMELVEHRIKQAQKLQESGDPLIDIQKPPFPVVPSLLALRNGNIPVPLIRGVWADSPADHVQLNLIVNKLESVSTVREFVEHVEELTNSRPGSSHYHPIPHSKQVYRALLALFHNERKRPLMSTAALNQAISYLLKHGLLRCALELLLYGEHVATVDTYNTLLTSAAKRQNLLFFRHILLTMSRLRIRPNGDTWLAYLECLVSPTAKRKLVKLMEKKGYLEPSVMRGILKLTIQDIFTEHLRNGGSVDEFFNETTKTAGPLNWFPPSVIDQMFSVTVQLKNVAAMERLIEICKQNGLPITTMALFDITRLLPKDTFSLLYYIFQSIDFPGRSLDKIIYERIFLNAWRNRHYNICRVLWRYACMRDKVTSLMATTMLSSLRASIPKSQHPSQKEMWQFNAGKVVVGVDLHLAELPLKDALLRQIPAKSRDHPVLFLLTGGTRPQDSEQSKRRHHYAAKSIMLRDQKVGPGYRPRCGIANMLEAAAKIDKEWQGIQRPIEWLLDNAIHVPVKVIRPDLLR